MRSPPDRAIRGHIADGNLGNGASKVRLLAFGDTSAAAFIAEHHEALASLNNATSFCVADPPLALDCLDWLRAGEVEKNRRCRGDCWLGDFL